MLHRRLMLAFACQATGLAQGIAPLVKESSAFAGGPSRCGDTAELSGCVLEESSAVFEFFPAGQMWQTLKASQYPMEACFVVPHRILAGC